MLVSFTQTYGKERDELLDIYFRDKRLIEFKNHFDYNIYSFHNCKQSTIDKFKELNTVKNTLILEFGRIAYTETIRYLKNYLKELNCTHFFFSQDDTFSSDNDNINWNELIEYVKKHDEKFMLNLRHTNEILELSTPDIKKNTFDIFESTTRNFSKSKGVWSFDDTPYICTVDMLREIYNNEYIHYFNIWACETHLHHKYKEREINRFVTNKQLLLNYNLMGINSVHEEHFRDKLKKKNLL